MMNMTLIVLLSRPNIMEEFGKTVKVPLVNSKNALASVNKIRNIVSSNYKNERFQFKFNKIFGCMTFPGET